MDGCFFFVIQTQGSTNFTIIAKNGSSATNILVKSSKELV